MNTQMLHTAIAEWHAFAVQKQHDLRDSEISYHRGYAIAMKHAQDMLEQIGRFAGMELHVLDCIDTDEAEPLKMEAVC